MIKKSNYLIILLLGLFCFCCNGGSYYRDISNIVKTNLKDSLKFYDKIVIIPGSGCTGCINSAERYFVQNVKNKKIKFILTYNFSKKNLTLKLGKTNIAQSNVIVDDRNIFYLGQYDEKIYPIAIIVNEGKIVNVDKLERLVN